MEQTMLEAAAEHWQENYNDQWEIPPRIGGYNMGHPHFRDVIIPFIGWHEQEDKEIRAFNILVMDKVTKEDAQVTAKRLKAGIDDTKSSYRLRQLLKLTNKPDTLFRRITELQSAVRAEIVGAGQGAATGKADDEMGKMSREDFIQYHTYTIPANVRPFRTNEIEPPVKAPFKLKRGMKESRTDAPSLLNRTTNNQEKSHLGGDDDNTMAPPKMPRPKTVREAFESAERLKVREVANEAVTLSESKESEKFAPVDPTRLEEPQPIPLAREVLRTPEMHTSLGATNAAFIPLEAFGLENPENTSLVTRAPTKPTLPRGKYAADMIPYGVGIKIKSSFKVGKSSTGKELDHEQNAASSNITDVHHSTEEVILCSSSRKKKRDQISDEGSSDDDFIAGDDIYEEESRPQRKKRRGRLIKEGKRA